MQPPSSRSVDDSGGPDALAGPVLAHDLEYRRSKAAVAANLFGEPTEPLRVGPYLLLRRLGAGGMGEVHAAYDPRLGREVALKLTRTDGERTGLAGETRLLLEARLLARVSHPNVVHVHEVGTFGDQVYIAMELIRGQTLRAWQAAARRRWREVLAHYLAAGRGLAAAHAAGLIHRDFKADNVLVDANDHVYVVDFGLARTSPGADPLEHAAATSGSRSVAGVAGTPGYIAPELYRDRPADARSDIYSFCVALFEALHGCLPPGAGAASEAAVTLSNLGKGSFLRRDAAAVPRWVDRVLAGGMALDPAARPASLAVVLAALARDPPRTRRRVAAAGLLLGLGGLGGALLPGHPEAAADACAAAFPDIDRIWNPARRAELAATFRTSGLGHAPSSWRHVDAGIEAHVAAWKTARRHACEASVVGSPATLELPTDCLEEAALALDALLARLVAGEGAAAERAISAVEALPSVERCGEPRGRDVPPSGRSALARDLRGALRLIGAHAELGEHREALRLAEQAVPRARAADDPALLAELLLLTGRLRGEIGRLAEAEADLMAGVDLAEANRLDELAATGWLRLTTLAARLQVDPARTALWGRRAAATLDRLGDDGPRRATLLEALGVAAAAEGRHADAAALHREALARLAAHPGETDEAIAAEQSLANALAALGRPREALAHFEAALARSVAVFGEHHPQYARVAHDMALLIATSDGDRARALLERALAIWTDTHGETCLECARTHTSLAHQAQQAGDLDRAERHARQALALYRGLLPSDHEDFAAALVNLGVIAHLRGDLDAAIAAYREAMSLQARSLSDDHPYRAVTASNLGESLVAAGRHAEALAAYALAEPIVRAAPTPDDELLAEILSGKGEALAALDRVALARAAFDEAIVRLARAPGRAREVDELVVRVGELRSGRSK